MVSTFLVNRSAFALKNSSSTSYQALVNLATCGSNPVTPECGSRDSRRTNFDVS
ncbi:hypothetical protein BGZ54_002747, partial [Gamsiella multidivaricata]